MAQDTFDILDERAYSIPKADSPELAALGPYSVGVTELTFKDEARPDIVEAFAGRTPMSARNVPVTIWYPAVAGTSNSPAIYTGKLNFRPGMRPEGVPETYRHSGIASVNAEPASGERYPLIVISHGYGNWAGFLSYLGENLASKGFVVASIEHNDLPYTDLTSFNISFGNTMLNRSRDQRFVVEKLIEETKNDSTLGQIIDANNIGLIGYSMGGFGAMASAGAGYDQSGPSLNQISAAMLSGITEGEQFAAPHPALKAVVAIAPWGGAPANRSWTQNALENIKLPLFFIAGDHDDVSGFEDGIKWLYDGAVNADRHMLVYENGRHSIGGNPEPPFADDYFDMTDWFNEPVWRRDRIVGINQHFITAFMNLYLKANEDALSYMDVTPIRSSDSEWPVPPGGYTGNTVSNGDQDGKPYWKGFQRRWALGMQMHRAKGAKAK